MADAWLAPRLEALYDADDRLVAQGRFVTTTFLVAADDERCVLDVERGRVVEIRSGPLVMPTWTFAVRAGVEDWARFWSPLPPPGSHDLFALLKRRRLVFEGELHPLMANLLYFKQLLALPRTTHRKEVSA